MAWQYSRFRNIMQLGFFFNSCAMLYFCLGLSLSIEEISKTYPDQLEKIGWMAVVSVIGFNLAYMIVRLPPSRTIGRHIDYLPSHTTLLFFVGIGLLFHFSAILVISFGDYFLIDRNERFANILPIKVLSYGSNLLNVCFPIAIARYLKFRNRSDRNLLYFILCCCIFISISTISRFDFSFVVICLLYFFHKERIIKAGMTFCFILLSFALTLFYKPILYFLFLDTVYSTSIYDYNEYTNWIRHTIIMMTSPEVPLPHNGYLLALKSLFVISPEQDSLSEWYLKEFHPERAILFPGTSYGFTGIWEGYSAYGLPGVGMHFAFFGVLFGLLERFPTVIRHILIVFAMVLIYRLFRSEVYNFMKGYAWYYAYQLFAIVLVDKFLFWSQKNNPNSSPKCNTLQGGGYCRRPGGG